MKCSIKRIIMIVLLAFIAIKPSIIMAKTVDNLEELKGALSDTSVSEITLSQNIEITGDEGLVLNSGREVVLDLNGKTISMESVKGSTSYLLNNKGKITVKDSTDTNKDGSGLGKITYYSTNPDLKQSPTYASNTINNSGTFILESGLIENTTAKAPAAYVVDNNNSGSSSAIKINGGKLSSTYNWAVRMFANSATNDNKFELKKGEINGGIWLQVVNAHPKADFTVDGGLIKGNKYAFYVYDWSSDGANVNVTINGGKFEAKNDSGYAIYYYDTNSNLKINGGEFDAEYALLYFTYNKSTTLTHRINGGTFNGYIELDQKFQTNPDEEYTTNLEITDGKFGNDIYVWGHDGSNWYLSTNTKFIKGGVFKDIMDGEYDCSWPDLLDGNFEVTNQMKTTPAGYPYTMGYKVTLDKNYGDSEQTAIYTLSDGSMSELEELQREGYEFLGWNTKKDGTGSKITKSSKHIGAITLYAQWKLIPGNVTAEISSNDTLEVTVDEEAVAETILTEEEKAIVDSGKSIKIEVVVTDVTESVPTEEKKKIEETIKDKVVAAYIDISILKTIEGEETVSISNTNSKIKFALNVPEELLDESKPGRKFYIIRNHDGVIEILDSEYDSDSNTLTFETDKFSTYAIAYIDTDKVDNPLTGDTIRNCIVLLFLSVAGIITIIKMNKKQFNKM